MFSFLKYLLYVKKVNPSAVIISPIKRIIIDPVTPAIADPITRLITEINDTPIDK